MKLVKAIIRPNKVEDVKDALEKLHISGMTVIQRFAAMDARKDTPRFTGAPNTA